jgi:hypothetical protein
MYKLTEPTNATHTSIGMQRGSGAAVASTTFSAVSGSVTQAYRDSARNTCGRRVCVSAHALRTHLLSPWNFTTMHRQEDPLQPSLALLQKVPEVKRGFFMHLSFDKVERVAVTIGNH